MRRDTQAYPQSIIYQMHIEDRGVSKAYQTIKMKSKQAIHIIKVL
jgi:hypothetical protein